MRLSDVYYTTQTLDGSPEPPPTKPTPIGFYQGDDITFEVYLNYNGKPITVEEWDLIAHVKTTVYAKKLTWSGTLNDGVYKGEKEGMFKILIPSYVTAEMIAGTYWLGVAVKEKNGEGVRDLTVSILTQPFSVSYAIVSPKPNPERDGLEPTMPPPTDASKM